MAMSEISSVDSQRKSTGFMNELSSAACEWFLIFLMFVDAAISYLLTKFACYCELQTPCMLCSRLDHVFGNEKRGYYLSLLCSNHREEISSTIYCHIHDKLADVRGMCEECFMSIAMQNKPSSESYKLMVGKLGMDFERCGFQSPYSRKNFVPPCLGTKVCMCCNKPLITKTNAQRLLQLTPAGLGASRANVRPPVPRVPGRSRLSHRDNLKRIRDKISESATSPRSRTTAEKIISYVGYSELKFNSDSESDFPFSDDDDGSSTCREKFDSNDCFLAQLGSENLAKAETDKTALMKQFQQGSSTRPSILDESKQHDVNKSNDVKTSSKAYIGHDLGELKREKSDHKPSPSAQPELISLNDGPLPSNIVKGPSLSQANLHLLSGLMSLKVVPPKSTAAETPPEVPPNKGSTSNATQTDFSNEAASSMPNDADHANVSKPVVTNKEGEPSGTLAGQDANSDSVKVDEPVRLQPLIQRSNASNSEGIRANQNSASLDRPDCGFESASTSSVSEVDGENIVDRLKRQIEYDRKCMSSLYKELEEERSASAISANQAMAMITRLQEEKAALQMESLQYLRMMEEQAEYDMDALNKANDLIADKELEMQDLELELEFYRNNFSDESTAEHLPGKTSRLKEENKRTSSNDVTGIDIDANVPYDSKSTQLYEGGDKSTYARSCFLDLEDEKTYIKQCLKDLERKLHQVSHDASSSIMPNGVSSEKIKNGVENIDGNCTDKGSKSDEQSETNGISRQEVATKSNGSPSGHDGTAPSVEDKHFDSEESHADPQKSSKHRGKFDLDTLENEISDLNERLEALETDHDFLEHTFNTARGGKEGLQFLEEIATHLQELRKLEFGRR